MRPRNQFLLRGRHYNYTPRVAATRSYYCGKVNYLVFQLMTIDNLL